MPDKSKVKQNKRMLESKGKCKKKRGFWQDVLFFSSIAAVIAGVALYYGYSKMAAIPETPPVDINRWWGPNTTTAPDTSIRPFRIVFSDAMQEELRRKFDVYRAITTRKKSITETFEYGTNSDALAQIFAHWQFNYSFREREKYLNQFEHFKTNIQGLDVHFVHVRPKVEDNVKVLPILLLHGWPTSVKDFYEVIPRLTTPRPGHDFVFEIIVPSIPGFGFSESSTKPGFSPFHIATIMRNLMHRLGFKRYFIQGGDFGHSIGSQMATIFPDEVLGFHTNLPYNFSKLAMITWLLGGVWPSLLANELAGRMYPLKERLEFYLEEFGYMHLQMTKPDTIGIALTDSPVGLTSYIMDRFLIFSDPGNKYLPDGGLSKFSMTDILDNVMLYWTSSSITTAMRLYKESFNSEEQFILANIPTPVPTWALRLRHEYFQHPDFILRWKYPNLRGTTNLEEGGHFAAFERPADLADDIFTAVKSFRE